MQEVLISTVMQWMGGLAVQRSKERFQTVYDMLVECLREARQRRQVIIVTHNPNLAVVCDADQIIHSQIDKQHKNKVTYTTGSLENPKTNTFSIMVLEGTRPAFVQRDRKYHEEI